MAPCDSSLKCAAYKSAYLLNYNSQQCVNVPVHSSEAAITAHYFSVIQVDNAAVIYIHHHKLLLH